MVKNDRAERSGHDDEAPKRYGARLTLSRDAVRVLKVKTDLRTGAKATTFVSQACRDP